MSEKVLEQLETETEPTVIIKKKSGFLGKFIALLLGLILGFIAGVGGLAGGIYLLVGKTKIEKAFNTVNGITGLSIDYTQYLDGSYGEKTVLNLVGDVVETMKKIKTNEATLNDFNAISPMVATLVKGKDGNEQSGLVYKLAQKGIYVDGDELMRRIITKPKDVTESQPDTYLTDYILYCINKMPLVDFIDLLGDGTVDHENKMIMYLLYGKENIHYTSDGEKVTMLQRQVAVLGTSVYNEYGDELITNELQNNAFTQDGASYTLGTEALGTVEITVDEQAQTATLYYVFEANGETPVYFTPTPISLLQTDSALLSNINHRLTLADVLDAQILADNKILKYLSSSTIAGLPDAVTSLTVGEVFEDDMHITYTGADGQVDNNGETLYKGDFLDANGNKTTNPDEYVLKPTWAYMLTSEDGKIHKDLTVEHDMSVLTENLTRNVHNASINALIRDGIIEIHDEEDRGYFNKNIEIYNPEISAGEYKYEDRNGNKITTLGGLNVSQMLNLLGSLLELQP